MISVEQAHAIVQKYSRPLDAVIRPVEDSATFILDERIVSRENVPPFDNSAMDGYAVRSRDVVRARQSSPVRLTVIDRIHAGQVSSRRVRAGECIQIMTGAALPGGTDAVVKVECTRSVEPRTIDILQPVGPGENRRSAGDDIRKGRTLFEKGRRLSAFDTGLLVSIGRATVRVVRKPRVAILATGDELVGPGQPLSPGKIRASTAVVLGNLLKRLDIPFTDFGRVPDSAQATVARLRLALEHDVVLSTGGVSVGEADYVKDALDSLGIRTHFWNVRQKPGKPLVFGSTPSTLFFGLPGNPVSSLVCFELYVLPSLHRLAGNRFWRPIRIEAVLETTIKKKPGLRQFIRGSIRRSKKGLRVRPLDNQSSGSLSSLAFSNGLIELDEDFGPVRRGDTVSVLVTDLDSFAQAAYE